MSLAGAKKSRWSEYYAKFPCFSEERVRDGCHPYKFIHSGGAEKAIVLVHGLSDSPYYLRTIADFFYSQLGYNVYLPLLQCHGLKEPEGMAGVSFEAWKENVAFAVHEASCSSGALSIGGLSMGGTLSFLQACSNQIITGELYLFSGAFGLNEGAFGIVGWAKEILLRSPLTLLAKSSESLIGPDPFRYDRVSLNSAKELSFLIQEAQALMDDFEWEDFAPKRVFLASTEHDEVVSLRAMERLKKVVGEERCRQYSIPENEGVDHASVVLEKDIQGVGSDGTLQILERGNPHLPAILDAIREFQA